MRTLLSILVGIVGGFVLGIALSSFIGVFTYMMFDQPFGIKFLPYFTALFCAILIPMWEQRRIKQKSGD
ncbi:DUF5957 family protein [Lederbergia sp. NSJ-179]|uniref:DUF5957 family protein n=1 Tax=Lederbergia sp. NSJ-179 TaxID=2931402 RepID=UPI001FD0B2B0|nr:DUF5957 family protein [Lederbergia sp. NSJ-179]MCJ7840092.1 DUF5957 family protein [Lederbergia sp. NSJ-179]